MHIRNAANATVKRRASEVCEVLTRRQEKTVSGEVTDKLQTVGGKKTNFKYKPVKNKQK